MNPHEQFAEDLALYAVGTLTGDERTALELHLRDCDACRSEFERLRADVALLAFSTWGPRPPARSKSRLLSSVAKEPKLGASRREKKPRIWWWNALEWSAAAGAIIVLALMVHQNGDLQRRLSRVEAIAAGQQQQLRQAKQLLSALTSPEADRYVLTSNQAPPQPQARAIYVANNGTLVLLASHMPQLPAGKAYEVWLIPTTGAPIPAGVFRPNSEGSAAVVQPPLRAGVQAKTFAITVEESEGSSAPTSQPIMVGKRG